MFRKKIIVSAPSAKWKCWGPTWRKQAEVLHNTVQQIIKLYLLFGVCDFFPVEKTTPNKWANFPGSQAEQSKTILSGIARAKQKSIAGNVREARRRRQMVGEKAWNSEKYPLATQPFVAEFNLRWRKGRNLWLTANMKNKIERGCYGKEEANKFQASDNWFQRFKHRGHNISLRRKTKKKNAANVGRKSHSIVSERTKYGGPQVHSEFQTTLLILNLTPNSKNSLRILKTHSEF